MYRPEEKGAAEALPAPAVHGPLNGKGHWGSLQQKPLENWVNDGHKGELVVQGLRTEVEDTGETWPLQDGPFLKMWQQATRHLLVVAPGSWVGCRLPRGPSQGLNP